MVRFYPHPRTLSSLSFVTYVVYVGEGGPGGGSAWDGVGESGDCMDVGLSLDEINDGRNNNNNTVESRNYAPLANKPCACWHWAKVGRGLIRGIVTLLCDDHYRPPNATWARDLCTFSGCLTGKTREKRQSKA